MQEIILVFEDSHGTICVAKNYHSAISYLIKAHWLEDTTEIFHNGKEITVATVLGENQLDKIFSWSVMEFNSFFDGLFTLVFDSVYDDLVE